ncbi:hypothetical protein N0V83_004180 [Neocucurbitaria cava]|uniref:Uncharacterized protein n=1 Tax=Neocucurbitaria cava TaxID=798079 RepID=A0A9W8YD77_9PLEO|nr:hypothetical protein N0V83_004180 [Neocucurbitaria cava]
MVADDLYEKALPVLQDEALDEEDKTDRLEELLRKETNLTGKSLENIVLDCLWRYRDAGSSSSSPPPSRHTIIRRPSPAPWQANRAPTPVNNSPRMIHAPPGFGIAPPGFSRAKSSNASPFTSPRPSPRLAFSSPHIPHSPSLSAYQFSEGATPNSELYGDLDSHSVDWLVNEESGSEPSLLGEGTLNGAAAEWVQPQTMDMGPYDMLRSILRDDRSDEELEKVLEANGFDLSAALLALMGQQLDAQQLPTSTQEQAGYLIGKSMSPAFRPSTPSGQQKSNIVCKYFLSTGHCARADCRFSHDTSKTLCKYFLNGNCLAGDTCLFSHDPSALMARMAVSDVSTPPMQVAIPNFQMSDYDVFPNIHPNGSPFGTPSISGSDATSLEQLYGLTGGPSRPPPGLSPFANFTPGGGSRPQSRTSSRQQSRATTPSVLAVDDNEAFPSLGSAAAAKMGKRHHGKRGGHGHQKDAPGPNNLADVVRMSPSPAPATPVRKALRTAKSFTGSRENSAAAQAIPAPQHIPWLETGEKGNQAYLKARAEAFKHGSLRNKFLQSAAQAWNRSDSRAAKALSLRGQSENNLMREAHREAARILYEERNKDSDDAKELYVDLHGLHPDESVSYLEGILLKHNSSSRPVYAITGTGHHSKNGKDKVGKAIRGFLNEWRYAFREFSVPGDRNNVGGILGIDPSSYDKSVAERPKEPESEGDSGEKKDTKIRIMKRDEVLEAPKGPKRGS